MKFVTKNHEELHVPQAGEKYRWCGATYLLVQSQGMFGLVEIASGTLFQRSSDYEWMHIQTLVNELNRVDLNYARWELVQG